ncbi:MAG: DUF262 domain-containing protein [Acholeplasmataceae bacterium]
MKNNENVIVFNIKEICESKWGNKEVQIPSLQRGLVWKPAQIELVWDSILRGFPIGSFTLSESDTSNNSDNSTLFLLDGQQRFYAIGLGFKQSVWTNQVDQKKDFSTVLWLDIANDTSNSSRKHWIKTTTKYHPWGYNNNDECSILSASEKRKAMEAFGLAGHSIYIDPITNNETWPYKAEFPIPLHLLLNADFMSEDKFIESIIDAINDYAPDNWRKIYWNGDSARQNAISLIKEHRYFEVFKNAQNYFVSGTLLSDDVIQKETKDKNETSTDLEILFNRLGTGGTRITQAELLYSAITAYWGEIKEINEKLAEQYMPPSSLVILAFRLMLTEDKDKLAGIPNIQQIRKLRYNKDFANKIVNLYNDSLLQEILENVDKMISGEDDDKTPEILKLDIYKNHPEIVLLLMYFAYKKYRVDYNFIRGIVFYILWFSLKEWEVVQAVYKHMNNSGLSTSNYIMRGLFESVHNECINPIPKLNDLINKVDFSDQHMKIYNHIKYNKNLLLFAQRKYLNKTFQNYKPVSSSDWEEHNRPWDFDHIVPQDWISNIRGLYREQCKDYLNTIGNLAAIPFEINREKNAYQNWEYYLENSNDLYFDQSLLENLNWKLTYDKELTDNFIRFCKKRMNKIFNDIHNALFRHIEFDLAISNYDNLLPVLPAKRKILFDKLIKHEKLKEFKLFYVNEDTKLEIEADETKVLDWSRRWLSLGCVNEKDGFMVSITSMDGNVFEIGLRTLPSDTYTRSDVFERSDIFEKIGTEYRCSPNQWWYWVKEVSDNVEEEFFKFFNSISTI